MTKDLEKKNRNEIIRNPVRHDVEILNPVQKPSPFISFRYSYKEISSFGGQTHIRSKEKSFENGKFKSEEFEGTLPGNVYFNMVGELKRQFWNRMTTFMKPFSIFLPHRSKDKDQ
jgi:hypothetical protein